MQNNKTKKKCGVFKKAFSPRIKFIKAPISMKNKQSFKIDITLN